MGIREKFTRANWELNCLFRTGRLPQYRAPTPYYPRTESYAGWFGGRHILCRACGRQVHEGSRFCDQCGARVL